MATYTITSKTSGADLGTYEGATAAEAIEAMHRDAGYTSSQDAADALGLTAEQLRADLDVREA